MEMMANQTSRDFRHQCSFIKWCKPMRKLLSLLKRKLFTNRTNMAVNMNSKEACDHYRGYNDWTQGEQDAKLKEAISYCKKSSSSRG